MRLRPTIGATLALLAIPAAAAPLPIPSAAYSATAIYDIDGNRYTSTVAADRGRERYVVDTPYGPQTLFVDHAAGKAYLQSPLGAFKVDLASASAGLHIPQFYATDADPVGRETVDGMAVTKYRVSASPADNARFTGYVWSTADGIYVKAEGTGTYRGHASRVAMHLTGLVRAPQDPSTLSPPSDAPMVDANPIVEQFLHQSP
jgi:hypothetical protein